MNRYHILVPDELWQAVQVKYGGKSSRLMSKLLRIVFRKLASGEWEISAKELLESED